MKTDETGESGRAKRSISGLDIFEMRATQYTRQTETPMNVQEIRHRLVDLYQVHKPATHRQITSTHHVAKKVVANVSQVKTPKPHTHPAGVGGKIDLLA